MASGGADRPCHSPIWILASLAALCLKRGILGGESGKSGENCFGGEDEKSELISRYTEGIKGIKWNLGSIDKNKQWTLKIGSSAFNPSPTPPNSGAVQSRDAHSVNTFSALVRVVDSARGG